MSVRGARNEMWMVRMAGEGVPIAPIARIACVSIALARVTLIAAVQRGRLEQLPPEEWPNPAFHDRTARALPVEQIHALAVDLMALDLRPSGARLAAALALVGSLSRAEAAAIACQSDTAKPKTVDVFMVRVRRVLTPLGVAVETLWGTGYRMDGASQARLLAIASGRQHAVAA